MLGTPDCCQCKRNGQPQHPCGRHDVSGKAPTHALADTLGRDCAQSEQAVPALCKSTGTLRKLKSSPL